MIDRDKFTEEQFKAALFKHKVYENQEVAEHMQAKQMELLTLAAQQNPMMMGGMGAPPPGMMGGPGMGGGPMGPAGMPF